MHRKASQRQADASWELDVERSAPGSTGRKCSVASANVAMCDAWLGNPTPAAWFRESCAWVQSNGHKVLVGICAHLELGYARVEERHVGLKLGILPANGAGRQQRVRPRVRKREPCIGSGDDPRRHGGVYEGRNGRGRATAAL
jgi:hypothetical protein